MGVDTLGHGDHLHGQRHNEHKYDEADRVADGGDAGGFDRSSTLGYVLVEAGSTLSSFVRCCCRDSYCRL